MLKKIALALVIGAAATSASAKWYLNGVECQAEPVKYSDGTYACRGAGGIITGTTVTQRKDVSPAPVAPPVATTPAPVKVVPPAAITAAGATKN